jgi:hypothetical protein
MFEAVLNATPADRGSYCPQCGGITITDAMLAQHSLEENGASMRRNEAEAVYRALETGEDTCRRCGEPSPKSVRSVGICWPLMSRGNAARQHAQSA